MKFVLFILFPIVCGVHLGGLRTNFRVKDGINYFRQDTAKKTSKLANLYCQKITAYVNGTFQDPIRPAFIFDAQLQVSAEINLADKHVYFKFENFNRSYAEGYNFDLEGDNDNTVCNTSQDQPCSVSFSTLYWLDVGFGPYESKYTPWLLTIYPLEKKRFSLLDPVGNCATDLENDSSWDSDEDLYKKCFCCGDVYNPDPSLGCPVSPWS